MPELTPRALKINWKQTLTSIGFHELSTGFNRTLLDFHMRYLASIFFKSAVQKNDDGCFVVQPKDGIWEETLFVVFAESEDIAMSKANDIGRQESGLTYESESGNMVWEFVKVERVVPLDDGDLVDGCEIFSRYLKPAEAQSILENFDE